MLDKMIEHQGNYNIFVFPEKKQLTFLFALMKLLHNVIEGKIQSSYDPSNFEQGEKLKLGKAIVEFIGTEHRENELCLVIKLSDIEQFSAPIHYLPFFQKTTTNRRLSSHKKFVEAKKRTDLAITSVSNEEELLEILSQYKTHMESSIIYVTSIASTKEQVSNFKVFGRKISDALLFGKADYTGTIKNISTGQMGGIPAIVLASDLYAVRTVAENGHPIQSIVIDVSNDNALLAQLDALDDLIRERVPITCVTDVVNSFELLPLINRGFNIWRWDETSITPSLYNITSMNADRKIRHCAGLKIEYLQVDGFEISNAIQKLSLHREESKNQSVQVMKIFDKLNSLAFSVLRQTVPVSVSEIAHAQIQLNECSRLLETERTYMGDTFHKDISIVINDLRGVFKEGYRLLKQEALLEHLLEKEYHKVCIVVNERADKNRIREYWKNLCSEYSLDTKIEILTPAEYYLVSCDKYNVTIVVGWFKRAIMRKILFSFNTQKYVVLMYDYESRWKNFDSKRWKTKLNQSSNEEIVTKSLASDNVLISISRFNKESIIDASQDTNVDELNEIEMILRENKFKQYSASGGSKFSSETTEAIPVNFVGGWLAFYRTGHKVITATNIISQSSEKIETKLPEELIEGDFIVVRESSRDLIREMADILLKKNGKEDLRNLAKKWKEALEIEQLFSNPEEIYKKLVAAGCTRGYQAVKSWLTDEDIIAPQQLADLNHIAEATGSELMREMNEQIFAAARSVKAAHVRAGRILSAQLKTRISSVLENYGDIDPFNIWEPIEIDVEDVGTARILKIIDIGSELVVDITDTNRLLEG